VEFLKVKGKLHEITVSGNQINLQINSIFFSVWLGLQPTHSHPAIAI